MTIRLASTMSITGTGLALSTRKHPLQLRILTALSLLCPLTTKYLCQDLTKELNTDGMTQALQASVQWSVNLTQALHQTVSCCYMVFSFKFSNSGALKGYKLRIFDYARFLQRTAYYWYKLAVLIIWP